MAVAAVPATRAAVKVAVAVTAVAAAKVVRAKAKAVATPAAVKVAALGMEVKVDRAASGTLWLVFAVRNMVPAEKDMARLRVALEAIAAGEKGEYDGWGAPVVK